MSRNHWESLLKDDPGNELILIMLAKACLDEGAFSEAVRYYEEVLKIQPDFALGWAYLAKAKLQLNDKDGARKACEIGLPLAKQQKHEVPEVEILAVLDELDSEF